MFCMLYVYNAFIDYYIWKNEFIELNADGECNLHTQYE